jgi:hypothetical protein
MKKLISKMPSGVQSAALLFVIFWLPRRLEEQKHKDEDEKINLIEKQVVEKDPVAKHFIDLDDLDFILSEIKKDREGKMLKVEKMMMQGKIPVSSMLLLSSQSQVQLLCLLRSSSRHSFVVVTILQRVNLSCSLFTYITVGPSYKSLNKEL